MSTIFFVAFVLSSGLAVAKGADGTSSSQAGKSATTTISSVDKEAVNQLRDLDSKYLQAKSVTMDLVKRVRLELLGRDRVSKGKLTLSKGRMRMEIDSPDKSMVIIDGKVLWAITYPDPEFKGAAIQVVKAPVESKQGRSQGLVSILMKGGILKHFKIAGVQKEEKASVYFLQPVDSSVEFKRAQVSVSRDGNQMLSLAYWDELGNETRYEFSNVQFDKPVDENLFKYSPPANADVTVY